MKNGKYPNEDFLKHRQGPKRETRMNDWYLDSTGHKETKQFFSATPNGVPNNPTNFQSFTPTSSKFANDGQPDGDVVFRRNPYGDGEQIVQQDGPTFQRPTQMGQYFSAPDVDPKLDQTAFLSTQGPASKMSPARGMSTGFSGFGKGPGRNQARTNKA